MPSGNLELSGAAIWNNRQIVFISETARQLYFRARELRLEESIYTMYARERFQFPRADAGSPLAFWRG